MIETIDRQIVELLMEDGRIPSAEIARRLGNVSERAVRYRLARLLERGILQVAAIPNPKSLGYTVVADVFIEVEAGAILEVARRLASYECVSYVACSMGDVDVSIQIVGRDNSEVYSFVTDVVAKIPGVRKTSTLIVPVILKDVYQWRIPVGVCQERSTGPRADTGMEDEERGMSAEARDQGIPEGGAA
jgi:Lrp/AsnC family transcriptional regulator for asnA, asnC and gidA